MPPGTHLNSDSDLESVISLHDITNAKPRRNSTGPKYICSIVGCGASFKRLDHLDRHEYHHTGIKKHSCIYEGCGKTYSIVTHLKRHLRTTHERTEAPQKDVACSVDGCDKMFQSACNMQRHIREVHENPKIYHCPHCDEKFTQKLKMRRHNITKHTGDYPFKCEKCSKPFYQQWQYERHVPKCKIYPCPHCELEFEKWSQYIKHSREQHGRKCYKCDYCERIYGKPGELQKHIAAKHLNTDGERITFKCTHEGCNRSYTYERNLRQHILTAHSGKRFRCEHDECDRIFSSAQNLTKHLERDHYKHQDKQKNDELLPSVSSEVTKTKVNRKRRKDAGQPVVSNLVKLSGLAVEKDVNKLLRAREESALKAVVAALSQDSDDSSMEVSGAEVEKKTSSTLSDNVNNHVEFNSLLQIALQSD